MYLSYEYILPFSIRLRPRLQVAERGLVAAETSPVMSRRLSDTQKGHLARQLDEIRRITGTEGRPYHTVRRALQAIIEGQFPSTQMEMLGHSIRYPEPAEMLAQVYVRNVQRNWGIGESEFDEASIPVWTPQTDNEMLLPIPRIAQVWGNEQQALRYNFDEAYAMWDMRPNRKYSAPLQKETGFELRITPGADLVIPHKSEIEWVIFNPIGDGFSENETMSDVLATSRVSSLAGVEVMWAAALMPEWVLTWGSPSGSHSPFIGGLQVLKQEGHGWEDSAVGLEYWPQRSQYGYGLYYMKDRSFGGSPLPTVRRLNLNH